MFRTLTLIAGFGWLGLSATVQADTTLNFVDHAQQTGLVQTSQGLVRVEQAAAPNIYMLFDSKSGQLSVVNVEYKSYQQITPERIAQAATEITAAREQLKANFHKLPAAQQQQLKPLLDQMTNAEKADRTLVAKDKSAAAGITCQQYDVLLNDKPVQQVCSASAKALKISDADYSNIASMLTMLAEISKNLSGQGSNAAISPKEINGLPIITSDPKAKSSNRLKGISRDKIPADRFVIPSDYTAHSG